MSNVGLVCFDWGGVILRHCRSWEEGCHAAGLEVRADSLSPEFIARRRALTVEFQRGAIDPERFFAALSDANRGLYSVEELKRLHHSWLLDEYEGVDAIIGRLTRTPGVDTALLSNTNHAHWERHLPKADGSPPDYPTALMLKHRHASHLMGLAKPDPAIYREFEKLVGYRGDEILFFDDLADNIAAAGTLGWRTVLVDHTGDTATQIQRALEQFGVMKNG
ncbi:MAG: HAD-IA family hydrolase [Planctomycetes bacterium]|nr:HAD-IA family hydrolase [Planctomycetota bacterium]